MIGAAELFKPELTLAMIRQEKRKLFVERSGMIMMHSVAQFMKDDKVNKILFSHHQTVTE
jgi:hypothetical protein